MPPEPEKKSFPFLKVIVIVIILAVIATAVYLLIERGFGTSSAVALVNGQKITRSEYDERFAQLAAVVTSQGQSATTTEMQEKIKTQTLENLITETMFLQAAGKEGIKADEERVNAVFAENKAKFPDEETFQKALTDRGLTDATFKEFLTKDNIIRQYLTAHIDASSATATEAEVKALYDQVSANDKTAVPPLAEVRAEVENQIVQQKQQLLVGSFVGQLRASSTVETLLK